MAKILKKIEHVLSVSNSATNLIKGISSRDFSDGKSIVNVFDRSAKNLQRQRSASMENSHVYDYLKEESGYRLSDRVFDIKRKFDRVADLGCGKGYASKHLLDSTVSNLVMIDSCKEILNMAEVPSGINVEKRLADEELIQLDENSVDLVLSSLSLHWVNDLPGTFDNIMKGLKNDGVFIGSVFGGDTLFELRCSVQLAEIEREGGFGPHISPFTAVRDVGGLLNRSGFTMLTIDSDEMVINYPSMFELLWDLKGMGENNAAWTRKPYLQRDSLMAAAAVYKEMYGYPDESIPATFQILYFIGWKPDRSQPKALPRGSGNFSLKDLHRLDEVVKQTKVQPAKNPYSTEKE
ncbi:arginine-hydroxylase NDUFAF5, mitochondrial-like [Artemia franciscana]